MAKNKLPDHIEEYFADSEGSKEAIHSRELFKADDLNIDLKTDLTAEEITILTTLNYNDKFLERKGLKPVFSPYIKKFLRYKVSLNRKSRGEFVSVSKGYKDGDDILNTMSNLKNITDSKK